MVTVGNVEAGHLAKLTGDGLRVLVIVNDPELVAETVYRSYEVVLRLGGSIALDEGIQRGIVRIGEKDGLDVGIVDAYMLHAVFLLVATSQLVLLDIAFLIVVCMGTHHQTILRLALHGLGIDVVVFLSVLYQPTLVLELLEILCGLFVDARVILRRAYGKVYLWLDDVVEALLVVTSLSPRLLTVQHVVRPALHLLYQFLRWTNAFEWFYNSHSRCLIIGLP